MGGVIHSPKVRSILGLSMWLVEAVVLSGQLKLANVETKLRMEVGGVTRQCLRLGKQHLGNRSNPPWDHSSGCPLIRGMASIYVCLLFFSFFFFQFWRVQV